MKNLLLLLVLFLSVSAPAQYYYKDIVGNRESAELIAAYRKANVQQVSIFQGLKEREQAIRDRRGIQVVDTQGEAVSD